MSAEELQVNEITQFHALSLPGIVHGFVSRVPGIDVAVERTLALQRLDTAHRVARMALGVGALPFVTAEQVHGNAVAVVEKGQDLALAEIPLSGVDGIVTDAREVCLGIYVADCCAVYLVDPRRPAIGLVHSGKKGTELGIVPAAIRAMHSTFGTVASDLMMQLSPCIRPPQYEWDFAAAIREQCRAAGVPATQIHDDGRNTGADLERFYSYRMEKGRTGRMLAFLALRVE
ncbi:MAG: laccase domain-containing protein [Verrucomicrobia bacterium]|nr:laccase domain-containing protein [Verrucomicrobiota bacterium]MBV9657467.1 laccase domain-containing protein [Verrucomicrobiota bacterium]